MKCNGWLLFTVMIAASYSSYTVSWSMALIRFFSLCIMSLRLLLVANIFVFVFVFFH